MQITPRRWLLLLLVLLLPATAHALNVPLTVRNQLDLPREGAMLTMGVPFAQGAISSVDQLSIAGPGGPVENLETRVLTQWWDGTPRWVLFTLPVDVPARGAAVYTLDDQGPGPQAPSALSAVDDGSVITVSTGRLRLTVDKTSFRVIESAALDTDGDGVYETPVVEAGASAGLVVDGSDGVTYTASATSPTVAEIERQGPQSVTLLFKGRLTSDSGAEILEYVTRITAFANRAELKVQQTLHNWRAGALDYRGDGSVAFEDARIELATPFANPSVRVGNDANLAPLAVALNTGERAYLHQDSSGKDSWNKWTVRKNNSFRGWRFHAGPFGSEQVMGSGNQAEGWMELRSGLLGAAFGIDDFWQNYPNALVGEADGRLRAEFFSGFQQGDHSMRPGEQKTHTIRLLFFDDGGNRTQARMMSQMHPLIALAPPEYYLGTECFRRTVTVAQSPSPEYELFQKAGLYGGIGFQANRAPASAEGNRDFDDVYGWWDYGDFYAEYEHEGDRANLENDYIYGMILQMVRSGNFDWWKFIAPGAEHVADIDVYHTKDDLGWRNGGFFTHDRTGSNKHRTDYPQPGHYNAQGMFFYYYLTGDPVVYDSAIEVADNVAWRLANDGNGGISMVTTDSEIRSSAWFFNISTEAWRCTHAQKYLDAALYVMDKTYAGNRCWIQGPGVCTPDTFDPSWRTKISVWQLGIYMSSLADFLEERTRQLGVPDPRGVESLEMYGNWIQDYCWVPEAHRFANSWAYDTGAVTTTDAGLIMRVVEGLSNAYWVTGNPRMLLHCDEAFATAVNDPWFDGGGITYSNMKTQAVAARNGGAWMQYVVQQGSSSGSCLQVNSTTPDDGQPFDPSGSVLLLFSEPVDLGLIASGIRAEGSVSGPLSVTTEVSFTVASLSFDPVPVNGETLTITIDGGILSQAGHSFDGNNDGTCGDSAVLSFPVSTFRGVDQSPPAAVDDLQMDFAAADGGVILQWTAPADVGPVGMPSEVEIRYATSDPSVAFDWNTATPVPNPPAPELPGNLQEVDLGPIDASNGALRMAIRTTDAAGNVSVVSNVVQDNVGPQVLPQSFGDVVVEEGQTAAIGLLVSDAVTGRGRVTQVRVAIDGQELWQGQAIPLQTPDGASPDLGYALYTVDASNWSAGETHVLRAQGLDLAANWSATPAEITVSVVAPPTNPLCLGLAQAEPPAGTTVPTFNGILLRFDQEVDGSTVLPSAFHLSFLPRAGGSPRQYPVNILPISAREIQLTIGDTVSEAGQFTLVADATVQSVSGAPLGVGSACDPLPELVFQLEPDFTPVGCFHLVQLTPAAESSSPRLDEVLLEFDAPVLASSVDANSVVLERIARGKTTGLGVSYQWDDATHLRLLLDTPVDEPAEMRLSLSSAILSAGGAQLGSGDACDPLSTIRFFVQMGKESIAAGSDLDQISGKAGLIAVTQYQVVFSDLVPGETLRIYDTGGTLLHRVEVASSTYTLDTRIFGSFPDKQLIVLYRGKKQFIVVGKDVEFYRSYIGDIE